MEECIRFSVLEGARYYRKSKRAIQKALKNECLPGKKDTNDCRWFYKKDGDIYFHGLPFPENAKLQGLLACFGIGRYLVDKITDDGTIEVNIHKRIRYVVLYTWNRYLVSIGKIDIDIEESAFREFKTKNSIGKTEAKDICRIAKEHSEVLVYLWAHGEVWVCWGDQTLSTLIKMKVIKNEEIRISVFGYEAKETAALICKELAA